jgi:glycosidase
MIESSNSLLSTIPGTGPYFPLSFQISASARHQLALPPAPVDTPRLYRLRRVADRLGQLYADPACSAGRLDMLAVLSGVLRWLAHRHLQARNCTIGTDGVMFARNAVPLPGLRRSVEAFVELFPPEVVCNGLAPRTFLYGPFGDRGREGALLELLILSVQTANPAAEAFRRLFDDGELSRRVSYRSTLQALDRSLRQTGVGGPFDAPLLELLLAPVKASPDSLEGQLAFVRKQWQGLLPDDLLSAIDTGLAVRAEETRMRGAGPGPLSAPDYTALPVADEERFSPDSDWMSDLVLLAKSVHVWFDQLSRQYGFPVKRLRDIPDAELDLLARRGFSGLWLIGIWERSPASRQIKRLCGNPEAEASAYALFDYRVADELGGQTDLDDLDRRCRQRGIRLACDVVPNHTGIDSHWMREHPDWFVQTSYPPYPSYRFSGPDLSTNGGMSLYLEDGYWDHSDAAVVFKRVDHYTGEVRYIYHGNDGTHLPWNDTAQLNFLLPEVREAMIRTIIEVARNFRVIRFDAAMTLAKKHYQRLWFPLPGGGAGVPSRAGFSMSGEEFERLFPAEFWREVVDRMAAEVPDTLLLAEAFWLMESYFVRTLGMHRVYNSAFMHMMKQEDNAKYRQLLKKTLAFNPEILKRFVNFMNNPDEATAVEQFGKGDKYFGVAVVLATLPGLPMFGHGQVEGFREKYGMEYCRAYLQEEVDRGFVSHHEKIIFPLLHRRALFSGAENFELYDFVGNGQVQEDVLAYSNRRGEQRALVVYHNRPMQTGGRVHNACPRVGISGEQVENTLADALGLRVGEGIYYRFRDHCTGMQYLRFSRELAAQGLFVSLGPYQAHVFLDFVEIVDDDGHWHRLWQSLGGQPAKDLDRECRRLLHAPMLQALHQVLMAYTVFPAMDDAEWATALERFDAFLKVVQQQLHLPGRTAPLYDRLLRQLSPLRKLDDKLTAHVSDVIWPWMVLNGAVKMADMDAGPDGGTGWLDHYLLTGVAKDHWPRDMAEENLALLQLLFRYRENGCLEHKHWPGPLLDDEVVRSYLLVHRYRDCDWFNRERFERLVAALMITAVLESPESAADRMETCQRRWSLLLAKAAQAGYRLDKFRTLI